MEEVESLGVANTLQDRKWLVRALRAPCGELAKTSEVARNFGSRTGTTAADRSPGFAVLRGLRGRMFWWNPRPQNCSIAFGTRAAFAISLVPKLRLGTRETPKKGLANGRGRL